MPTAEDHLRSTERPRRATLPAPAAVVLPERVQRRAGATKPPQLRRAARHRPRSRRRGALSLVFVVVACSLGVLIALLDDHDDSRRSAPSIGSIASVSPGTTPAVVCPASQPPGLTATQDVIAALVQIRAAAGVDPLANCGSRIWPSGFTPLVDDFAGLGVVRGPVAISDVTGPPTATARAVVQFTVTVDGRSARFETQLARSPDDREWRLAYLRRVAN
ncbi:MAG TPA: hypothetical protein VEP49_17245 [Acidimicrobiia bacterium]|nr:hypothetical protein [Acidimicrobiia bacterium]